MNQLFRSSPKGVLGIIFTVAILMISCAEEVLVKAPPLPLLDTSFLTNAQFNTTKQTLLLTVNGVRAIAVPQTKDIVTSLVKGHGNRLKVLALYPSSPMALTYPWPGEDTLVSSYSDTLCNNLGQVSYLPLGSVDQITLDGKKLITHKEWAGIIDTQVTKIGKFDIEVKSNWELYRDRARVELKITSCDTLSSNYKFVVALIENNIISKQSDGSSSNGVNIDYSHDYVLRQLITPFSGVLINNEPQTQGFVRIKHYYVAPRTNWNSMNCEVLVWILNTVTDEIVQVNSCALR